MDESSLPEIAHASFVPPGAKVRLDDIPTIAPDGLDKAHAKDMAEEIGDELSDLHKLMHGAATHSLLLVLQGRDAAGKDGAARFLFRHIGGPAANVFSFKAPSADELAHDFLWRVHKVTPAHGYTAIFNRSHYEDVLVPKARKWLPNEVIDRRYAHINAFETLLAESNTIVLKMLLHVSKDEQGERFRGREEEPLKTWKLALADFEDRERWDDFSEAYQQMLSVCNAKHAPWFVVPADQKWHRNLAIAEIVRATLKEFRPGWEDTLREVSRQRTAEIAAARNSQ